MRRHGSIENRPHFVRNVVRSEGACRVRLGHAPQVFAAVRHAALSLLRVAGHERIASAQHQTRAHSLGAASDTSA